MPYPGLSDAASTRLDACVKKIMAQGHSKSRAIAMCRTSMKMSEEPMIRWVEPFTYQAGKPFRVMPLGTFKRGDRTLTITQDDLQQMAANFEGGRPRWKVPVYFGHPTAEQPDPPKAGNVASVEVRDDGLYAVPEYTDKGKASVEDGEYQFVSPGVLWDKNGSAYVDEQGRQFDNVIEHVALTNRPFFGQHVALFSEPGVVEKMMSDYSEQAHDYDGHRLLSALEAVSGLADGMENVEELAGPLQTAKNALKEAMNKMLALFSDGKARSDDFAVWTAAFMNDLPDSSFLYIESGGEKDESGKTKPRSLRHFPYKDAGGKTDLPHLRNALARIPQSSLPADVKERVAAKARRLAGGTGEIEVREKDSVIPEGEKMTDKINPQSAVSAEEFAALKAKADKLDALEIEVGTLKTKAAEADTFATQLVEMKRQRRRDQLLRRAEQFVAIPEKPETIAEKFQALEEMDAARIAALPEAQRKDAPSLFTWFDGLLGTLDQQLVTADLFGQKSIAQKEQADTFEAAVEAKLTEKFAGDRAKYAEAFEAVGAERPDLAHQYTLRQRKAR